MAYLLNLAYYICGADFSLRGASAPLRGAPDKLNGGTEVPRRLKSAPHMSASICERSRGVSSVALKAIPSFFTPVDPTQPVVRRARSNGRRSLFRLRRNSRIQSLCGTDFVGRTSVPPFHMRRAPQSGAEAPRRLKSAPHESQPSRKLPERVSA